jgi:hypothetical protein
MADNKTIKRLISNIDISIQEKSPLLGDNKKPRIEEKVESEKDDIDTEIDDIDTDIDREELSQNSTPEYLYSEYTDKVEKYGLKNVLFQQVRNENSLLSRIDSGRPLYEDTSDHDTSDNDSSKTF